MLIHILRHGKAESSTPGTSDAQRRLTPEGRDAVRAVLRRARYAGVSVELLLASPYVRAVQTAEIAGEVLAYQGETLLTSALVPSGSPSQIWEELRGHSGAGQVLIVGHEPLLSQLAAFLLSAPALRLDLPAGGLVSISVEQWRPQPAGVLRWMLTPALAADR